jgi:hypothetical protein
MENSDKDSPVAAGIAVIAGVIGFCLAGVMGRGTGVSIAVAFTGAIAAYFVTLMIRNA